MKSILLWAMMFLCIACNPAAQKPLSEVQLDSGKISGIYNPKTHVYAFKGIPYAKPPVGDLRWRASQPVTPWKGIRKCTMFGASAIQPAPGPFSMWTSEFIAPASPLSENCLYLNVWTAAQSNKEKRPVIVFIHGGAFRGGSGSVPLYNGTAMAEKGVVFVTINYRLGIFGFFALPELTAESKHHSSGNYGFLDQIAALKWVKKNIAAFGGDPNNVTIAGQSAGAWSVCTLVASPLAKGLFEKAIAESGALILPTSFIGQPISLADAEKAGEKVAKSFGVSSIAALREIPAEKLLHANMAPHPVIDGYVIPEDLFDIFSKGRQNDVPLILGWNEDEMNRLGALPDYKTYMQNVKSVYGKSTKAFLKYFPAHNDSTAHASELEYKPLLDFGVQMFEWMNLQDKTGKSDVYFYHFTRDVPFGKGQNNYGAFHSGELGYAYHNLDASKVRPWTASDYQLENVMSSYWVNFSKTGNPNDQGLPEWMPCKPDAYKTMILGKTWQMETLPHLKALEFLRDFFVKEQKEEK
ncbi:MAG: carboxylesterase family protein [Bacteroidales bacterium]|nr:carboxylesterase family protein [Bacteroidales bacterium]